MRTTTAFVLLISSLSPIAHAQITIPGVTLPTNLPSNLLGDASNLLTNLPTGILSNFPTAAAACATNTAFYSCIGSAINNDCGNLRSGNVENQASSCLCQSASAQSRCISSHCPSVTLPNDFSSRLSSCATVTGGSAATPTGTAASGGSVTAANTASPTGAAGNVVAPTGLLAIVLGLLGAFL